ncbi:MAG: mechanosensitive ion channel [Lentisphaerales bacterium]|jgi:small-conductance mechanosensitive channel|nr:MAG: mechanosensitive ion channel [Lentisphaerales bacterium]
MSWFETFLQEHAMSVVQKKILYSILIFLLLSGIRFLTSRAAKRKITDLAKYHSWRRAITYAYGLLVVVLVGRIWISGIDSIATFLGLASAGLAIAMHDTVSNVTGWFFILWRQPFKLGDRIEIGGVAGDVIDMRLFEFSLIEIGRWVDAEQSTGRIVHVPNGKVLREHLINYETGFAYIWHEIPVLITFESDWQKAKDILTSVVNEKAGNLSGDAEAQIKRAASKYLIFYKKLTPVVYTTVRDCGVLLTMRYIVKPRERRHSEEVVWEAVLREFAKHGDIQLAYPTTRFYRTEETAPGR